MNLDAWPWLIIILLIGLFVMGCVRMGFDMGRSSLPTNATCAFNLPNIMEKQ